MRMKTEAIMSVTTSPHEIKTANVSTADSPFCRAAKDENSHFVLKIFQVYIQHFNSEKGRLETKLLMFRENLMKQHKLLHSMFMGHQKK